MKRFKVVALIHAEGITFPELAESLKGSLTIHKLHEESAHVFRIYTEVEADTDTAALESFKASLDSANAGLWKVNFTDASALLM